MIAGGVSAGMAKLVDSHCCWKCWDKKNLGPFARLMIVCPYCGNKRCPRASDHMLECSGSNEPGQEGSVY